MNENFTPSEDLIKFTFRPFILASPSYLNGCTNINYSAGTPMAVIGVFSFIALISMVASSFIAITIFYNPKLSIHPSKLIGYMCICEGLSCFNALIWAANPINVICYFGLHYVFSWTVLFSR